MKILVCNDGSTAGTKVMERAAEIVGERKDMDVTVIHVYEKKTLYRGVNVDYLRMTKEEYDSIIKVGKLAGKKILDDAVRFFKEKNIPVKTILQGGHPAQTIVAAAQEGGYDLIIIGRRGMSGLNRLFLGSVSNAVLQEAKTDVLLIK